MKPVQMGRLAVMHCNAFEGIQLQFPHARTSNTSLILLSSRFYPNWCIGRHAHRNTSESYLQAVYEPIETTRDRFVLRSSEVQSHL
jgi:hypothetical protein